MEPSSAHEQSRRVLASAGVGAAALFVALAAAVPAWASGNDGHAADSSAKSAPTNGANSDGHNPPGNNGTVFIHDVAGDHSPHNVPHVGCTFYVDFFGFDSNQTLSTSFVGQAPTGPGIALTDGDWTGQMPDNNAGGAGNDFDVEQAFTLDTSVLGDPQPQQGFHVKLTVSTGEPGGVKHKVFWIAPCQTSTPTAPTSGTTTQTGGTTENGGTTQTGGTSDSGGSTGGAEVQGLTLHRGTGTTTAAAPTKQVPTKVLGLTLHRGPRPTTRVLGTSTPRSLPFTGAEIGGLVAAAAAALGGGAGLTLAGRRRRRPTH